MQVRKMLERLAWSVAAIAVVIAVLVLGVLAYFRRLPQDAQTVRFFRLPARRVELGAASRPRLSRSH